MKNIQQRFSKVLFSCFIFTVVFFAAWCQQALSANTFVQKAKIIPSDCNWQTFGTSVDIYGSWVAVGAPAADMTGAAYVFKKLNDQWQQTFKVNAYSKDWYGPNVVDGSFGKSVAISYNRLVVGQPGFTWEECYIGPCSGISNAGIVYTLARDGDNWSNLIMPKGGACDNAYLGAAVAIDGSTAVVGEPAVNMAPGGGGRCIAPGGGMAQVLINGAYATTLIPDLGEVGDGFGYSVAIDGNTVVVGDYKQYGKGRAYVFEKPAAGWASVEWMVQTAILYPSDIAAGDEFGYSVAIDGNTVVVGAQAKDGMGAAYVFVKPGSGWPRYVTSHNARLFASSQAGDNFGCSVAIQGDRVLVGAPGDDVFYALPRFHIVKDQGSVSLFVKPAGGWSGNINRTQILIAADGASGDQFGASVAIDGETVVVGAPVDNDKCGAVYVFDTYNQTSTTTVSQSSTTTTGQGTSTTTTAEGSSTTTTTPGDQITVDFTASPTRGFAPLEVHFSNISSGNIAGYEWTFGDGTASIEKNPTHAYAERGSYSVVLTAEGQDGSSHVKMKKRYIRVFPNLPCVASTVFEDRDDILNLKHVRDALLNKPAGMMLVYLYYRHSAEIGDIIAAHPEIGENLQKLVHENMDLAQAIARDESTSVSAETVQSAMSILWEIRDSAGVELEQSINLLLSGIRSGYLLSAMEIGLD